MRTSFLVSGVLMVLVSAPVLGACEITPREHLPEQSWLEARAREKLFRSTCNRSPAGLVDADDVRLGSRIGRVPSKETADLKAAFYYPKYAQLSGAFGAVTLAVVVEVDGRLVLIGVTKSSGNGDLDEAAKKGASRVGRIAPYSLDGFPVRIFKTWTIKFTSR